MRLYRVVACAALDICTPLELHPSMFLFGGGGGKTTLNKCGLNFLAGGVLKPLFWGGGGGVLNLFAAASTVFEGN